jgi:hypothetical protein
MVVRLYANRREADPFDINNDLAHNVPSSVSSPLNKYRMDIMTYRYPIDNMSPDSSEFYFNQRVRGHIARIKCDCK